MNKSMGSRFEAWRHRWMVGLSLLVLSLVAGCGGGLVPGAIDASSLRALPASFLERQAIAYSPYRSSNRDTETVSKANILEDLQLLIAANYKLIRVFGSGDGDTKKILEVIREQNLDMKVMLGLWMAPKTTPDTFNQAEISRGVILANVYADIVLAVSVGNETMVNWNTWAPVALADMVSYIKTVRAQVPQPVTTDDNWAFFANSTGTYKTLDILKVVDFVAMHSYVLADSLYTNTWDWQQTSVAASGRAAAMMAAAFEATKKDFAAVRTYLNNNGFAVMPIIVGETGWKASASNGETYRAHPVNQKIFLDNLKTWKAASTLSTGPLNVVYFEAFDEPWKGTDDKWGLFTVDRKARYALQGISGLATDGTSYSAADAVYYVPASAGSAITANRLTVLSETAVLGEVFPAGALTWNGWQDGVATAYTGEITSGVAEGTKSIEIAPAPKPWGWGMTYGSGTSFENLSNFTAGHFKFMVKTSYPGKIEVGFLTGDPTRNTASDVYLTIQPGEYGYKNDGTWTQVSIPISAIAAQAAPAYNQPSNVTLKMDTVGTLFVIADRYVKTGKTTPSVEKFWVDDIHWTRD
jgi:exo-beta-1,3-glucanase (GH17 family)